MSMTRELLPQGFAANRHHPGQLLEADLGGGVIKSCTHLLIMLYCLCLSRGEQARAARNWVSIYLYRRSPGSDPRAGSTPTTR